MQKISVKLNYGGAAPTSIFQNFIWTLHSLIYVCETVRLHAVVH